MSLCVGVIASLYLSVRGRQTVENEGMEEVMIAVDAKNIRFKPGRVLATPGAISALEQSGQSLWHYLALHLSGNWGVVDDEDKEANEQALKDGSRLLSAYLLPTGEKIWIITEAEDDHGNRASSTALTPDEY